MINLLSKDEVIHLDKKNFTLWEAFKNTNDPAHKIQEINCEYCDSNIDILYRFAGQIICKTCLEETEYEN